MSEVEDLVRRLVGAEELDEAVLSDPRRGEVAAKVAVKPVLLRSGLRYQLTEHLADRTLSRNLPPAAAEAELVRLLEGTYRQGLLRAPEDEYQVLVSRGGSPRVLRRPRQGPRTRTLDHDRPKRYLLEEGVPNPFLLELGVMDAAGRVRARRYGKFRQLNRFLELVDDVVTELPRDRPVRVVEAGSGKAYLTFALYQHLTEARGLEVEMLGLDLKRDVVEHCEALVRKLGYEGLRFEVGDVGGHEESQPVDLVLALHACDTATDEALERAVRWEARVILAVPCCQKELARQLSSEELGPLLEHGILRERFAALMTDGLRAQLLELVGYRTQVVEFVDLEHPAKNVLIRALRRERPLDVTDRAQAYRRLRDSLGVSPYLERALADRL